MAGSSSVPGFVAVSDSVFERPGISSGSNYFGAGHSPGRAGRDDPDIVVIFGWGDGLPRQVAMYANGFRQLYPQAKQVMAVSPTAWT
ncbi:hypothetical protein CDD83_7890 [Cordyceps sp. RAO-2017]|nr:hypothetical protein CDD83_7890 [Cordyceps sp. RAO-2017]